MDGVKRWTVVIDIRHVDGLTRAGAHLYERDSDSLTGHGLVLDDGDPSRLPQVAEELATAYALADLAARLRRQATEQAVAPSSR